MPGSGVSTYFLKQDSSPNLEFNNSATQAGQQDPKSFCLCPAALRPQVCPSCPAHLDAVHLRSGLHVLRTEHSPKPPFFKFTYFIFLKYSHLNKFLQLIAYIIFKFQILSIASGYCTEWCTAMFFGTSRVEMYAAFVFKQQYQKRKTLLPINFILIKS